MAALGQQGQWTQAQETLLHTGLALMALELL